MMTPTWKAVCISAAIAAMLLPAAAQTTTATSTSGTTAASTAEKPKGVNQRKENQQDRISQGVQTGQLTAGEAAKMENKESALNKEVHAERQANGGKLTPTEKAQVNQQQHKLSQQVYKQKHNSYQQKP